MKCLGNGTGRIRTGDLALQIGVSFPTLRTIPSPWALLPLGGGRLVSPPSRSRAYTLSCQGIGLGSVLPWSASKTWTR